MKRPSFFSNYCGCPSSTHSRVAVPVLPATGSLVYDDAYFTLITAARMQVLGVQRGSNAQAFFSTLGPGFLFQGTDGQATVEDEPALTLPIVNAAVDGSFPASGTAKYIMVGNGADPATWQMIAAPTSGSYILTSSGGTFSLQPPGDVPALNAIFAAATSSTHPEAIGFVQTGTDGDGNPVFSSRKFAGTGTGDQPMVVRWNGTSGRYEITGLLTSETLKQTTIGFQKLQGLDNTGANISGGFTVRPDSGITQSGVDMLAFDSATNIVYRAAPSTVVQISSNTTTAASTGSMAQPTPHWSFGAQTIHYPNVEVEALCVFDDIERPIITLYVDGVEVFRWDFTTNSTTASGNYRVQYILTGLALGSHTFDFRMQTTTAANIIHSTASLKTLR